MFISHKYKVIFIHIQRTGGSSVTKLFLEHDADLLEHIPVDPAKSRTMHCFISDIQAAVEPEIFSQYTKFCIVRNPYDRMVSWYFRFKDGFGSDAYPVQGIVAKVQHLIKKKNIPHKNKILHYWVTLFRLLQNLALKKEEELATRSELVGSKLMIEVAEKAKTFEDFVLLPSLYNNQLFERFCTNQLEYISENQNIIVDRILRFENLSEDFNEFAQDIGIAARLPHVNASQKNRTKYQEYYSEKTKEIITERFTRDIEYFNYQF